MFLFRNKRPDLRRDCDPILPCGISRIRISKQTTWFTKGLRLFASFRFLYISFETNDLIYEGIATLITIILYHHWQMKQTTWFTKGLRRYLHRRILHAILTETNDLIYEGIATFPLVSPSFDVTLKQTTWFTKGLRLWLHIKFHLFPFETNDLIYEGIATQNIRRRYPGWNMETNDLIYEGIATPAILSADSPPWYLKQTTWFTKGLRQCENSNNNNSVDWNKRPDLRRDCDHGKIYPFYCWLKGNKRPDLRRDCDELPAFCSPTLASAKQTTWFTKGLRRFCPET